MTSATPSFRLLLRVRYAECDAQGIVFNARYLDYVDTAATEFMRAVWGDYRELVRAGLDTHVVHAGIDWTAPARFDDVIALAVHTSRVGRTSFTLTTEISRLDDGRELARAEVVYVTVATESGSKQPVPQAFSEPLRRGAPGRVVDHAGAGQGTP